MDKPVLKVQVGDEISPTEADFVRIFAALFAGVESKYL
jgi:hypothetical protein